MSSKKVTNLIIEKFAANLENDGLFENIAQELMVMIQAGKHSKDKIEKLLKKKQNEDTEPRS